MKKASKIQGRFKFFRKRGFTGFCTGFSRGLFIFSPGLLFVSLGTATTARADDILQLNVEGASSSDVPVKAREESLSDALNKGCLQAIGNLIGDSRLEKSLPVVKSKVLSQKQRFIQFYKASEPVKKGNDTLTSINMKISISSLRDILAKEGILYQSDGPATILPVVRFV